MDVIEGKESPGTDMSFMDLNEAMEKYPDVQFRFLMAPDKIELENYDRANFDGAYTQPMIDHGISDAKRELNLPEGYRFRQL